MKICFYPQKTPKSASLKAKYELDTAIPQSACIPRRAGRKMDTNSAPWNKALNSLISLSMTNDSTVRFRINMLPCKWRWLRLFVINKHL